MNDKRLIQIFVIFIFISVYIFDLWRFSNAMGPSLQSFAVATGVYIVEFIIAKLIVDIAERMSKHEPNEQD